MTHLKIPTFTMWNLKINVEKWKSCLIFYYSSNNNFMMGFFCYFLLAWQVDYQGNTLSYSYHFLLGRAITHTTRANKILTNNLFEHHGLDMIKIIVWHTIKCQSEDKGHMFKCISGDDSVQEWWSEWKGF